MKTMMTATIRGPEASNDSDFDAILSSFAQPLPQSAASSLLDIASSWMRTLSASLLPGTNAAA